MATKRRAPESLRRQVRDRAGGRCEYCLIHEDDTGFPHQADHIIAENHGGQTTLDNLAWACITRNRHKGTDIASIDPTTSHLAAFYNPRRQRWHRHFPVAGGRIEPRAASGRVAALLFNLNGDWRIQERIGLIGQGRYPGT